MQSLSYRSRYRGAMLAVLAGDVLGAVYETRHAPEISKDIKARGGLTFFPYPDPFGKEKDGWPPGRPTDDSEMTAALAMSLIDRGGFDAEDLYGRFHRLVMKHESVLWDGPSSGFGRTTRTMVEYPEYEESRTIHKPPRVASNGSLMRTVPVALRWYREPGMRTHIARLASEVTHLNPISGEACIIYCGVLGHLMDGMDPKEGIEVAFRRYVGTAVFSKEISELETKVFEDPEQPEGDRPWHVWGSAVYSLHTALAILLHARSVEDGIAKAILRGGDTDTYAAILGGLLGAHFGEEGIPNHWVPILKGGDRMIEFADRLHDIVFP